MRLAYRPLPARQEYAVADFSTASFHFGEAFYPSRLQVDNHAHKNHSVTLVLQGSLTETYGRNRAQHCAPASVLFRPGGEPHRDFMGNTGALNLEVELTDFRTLDFPEYSRLFARPSTSQHPRLSALACQIHSELRVKDIAQSCILEGLALELVGIASRVSPRLTKCFVAPVWLSRVYEALHDRYMEPLRVTDLAAIANVHPVHLARAFRAHYGLTPGMYLRRLRLQWAAEQLSQAPAQSLSDIAASAGFADQSHFTRAFKECFGASPGRVRQMSNRRR